MSRNHYRTSRSRSRAAAAGLGAVAILAGALGAALPATAAPYADRGADRRELCAVRASGDRKLPVHELRGRGFLRLQHAAAHGHRADVTLGYFVPDTSWSITGGSTTSGRLLGEVVRLKSGSSDSPYSCRSALAKSSDRRPASTDVRIPWAAIQCHEPPKLGQPTEMLPLHLGQHTYFGQARLGSMR